MDRRELIASAVASTAALSGCIGTTPFQNKQDEELSDADGVSLERVTVTNGAEKATNFNITVVVSGGRSFSQSQLSVDPDESTSPSTTWESPARSFVVIGYTKKYNNMEVVAVNRDDNRTDTAYVVDFEIDQQGGVGWELNTTASN